MKKRNTTLASTIRMALLVAAALAADNALAENGRAHGKIADLIANTYDQPGSKVQTGPIVVADGYALADWMQGDLGGRALLRRSGSDWEIVVCGGDGLKDSSWLQSAGMSPATAERLVARLDAAEQPLAPERVQRFDQFADPATMHVEQQRHATALAAVVVVAHPVIESIAIDPFASSSAVVSERQLRDQNVVDLAGALRRTPGVQVSRFNPVGSFGGEQDGVVLVRGLGASRPGSEVKTYLDGLPLYMGVWGHPLLDLLPVNGMESITVFKSPQPQINGNNFASIDLRSKRAKRDGVHGNARLSAGAHDTLIEQADLSGGNGDFDFSIAQGHAESSGHRRNADGNLDNFMGRIGYRFGPVWSAEASLLLVDNEARDPGDNRVAAPALAPQYNSRVAMAALGVIHDQDNGHGEFRVYGNRGEGYWLDQPAPGGDTLTRFRMGGLLWKETFSPWQGGTVVAGIDHDRISGDVRFNRIAPAPSTRFDTATFKTTSEHLALSQEWALGADWRLTSAAGLRLYQHSEFDAKTAPHAGITLASDKVMLFANLSRGINYPGLETEVLASLIPPLGDSWQQLSAEQLNHAEIGAQYSPSAATRIDLSLFTDKVKNRYVFGFPPNVPPPPQFINLGSYRMRGMELAVQQDVGNDWSVFAGLTLLDPNIAELPYTPKRALSAGLNGKLGRLTLAMDAQYQSPVLALNRARAAGAINTERVAGFAVFNARVAYPVRGLGPKGEVFVAIDNLLDRDYAYRPGYPMPGRAAQVGIAASF